MSKDSLRPLAIWSSIVISVPKLLSVVHFSLNVKPIRDKGITSLLYTSRSKVNYDSESMTRRTPSVNFYRTIFAPLVLSLQGTVYFSRVMIVASVCGKFNSCFGLCLCLHFIKTIVYNKRFLVKIVRNIFMQLLQLLTTCYYVLHIICNNTLRTKSFVEQVSCIFSQTAVRWWNRHFGPVKHMKKVINWKIQIRWSVV